MHLDVLLARTQSHACTCYRYNLTGDPNEMTNLALSPAFKSVVDDMTRTLKGAIDFPAVSLDVANYSKLMFTEW